MPLKREIPNFAAWSNKNLADFATEAYLKMLEQEEELEEANIKLLAVKLLSEQQTPD
jgi:hypothetical protein